MKILRAVVPLMAVVALCLHSSPGSAAQESSAGDYPEPGAPAIVKLTSPGKEPRAPLRYSPPVGATAAVSVTITSEGTMDMSAGRWKMPMTSLVAGVELGVKDVSAVGDVVLDVGFVSLTVDRTNPRVDLAAAQQVEAMMAGLVPFRGVTTITNRGIVTANELKLGALAKPGASSTIEDFVWLVRQITPVLPEEPVGVGAKWESRQSMVRSDMTVFQRVEFEVTSVAGGVIKVKSSINQTAPKQPARVPNLKAGATIERYSAKGSYTSTLDLKSLSPVVQGTTTTTISVSTDGVVATLSTTLFSGIKPAK